MNGMHEQIADIGIQHKYEKGRHTRIGIIMYVYVEHRVGIVSQQSVATTFQRNDNMNTILYPLL
jgi:hypothetical protein